MVQGVQNNGSVYLHAFFTPSGFTADPADPFYKKDAVFHKTFRAPLLHACTPLLCMHCHLPVVLCGFILLHILLRILADVLASPHISMVEALCRVARCSRSPQCMYRGTRRCLNRLLCPRAALNTYLPRPKNKTGVNLLSSPAEQADARIRDAEAAEKPREVISYLKPYVSIALVDDATSYPAKAIPEHVSRRSVGVCPVEHAAVRAIC